MTGTSLYGILLAKYDPAACLRLAIAIMIGSLPVLVSSLGRSFAV